jgi:hypothetical protein
VPAGLGIEDAVQAEFAESTDGGGDMTVRKGAKNLKRIRRGSHGGSALKDLAESIHLFGGPMRDVGDSAIVDFAVEAEGFAEEDGGRGVAVGDYRDIHALSITHSTR